MNARHSWFWTRENGLQLQISSKSTTLKYRTRPSFKLTDAFNVGISLEPIQTRAYRLMGLCQARRVIGTSVLFAHWSTSPVQSVARFVVCAVFVILAHHRHARHGRRSLCTRRTNTMSFMGLYGALGSVTTAMSGTRIQTVTVDTRFVVNTIAVSFATSWNANEFHPTIIVVLSRVLFERVSHVYNTGFEDFLPIR